MTSLKTKLRNSVSIATGRLTRKFKALRENEQGVAAIEFALIAPVMFGIYFGITVMSITITADRNVSHATGVASDLTTRFSTVDRTDAGNILTAAIAILGVSQAEVNSGNLRIEINSYRAQPGTGTATVPTVAEKIGFASVGPDFASEFNIAGVDQSLINETSGLVVARIQHDFKTFGSSSNTAESSWTLDNITLEDSIMTIPRNPNFVPFGDGSVNSAGSQFKNCTVSPTLIVTC